MSTSPSRITIETVIEEQWDEDTLFAEVDRANRRRARDDPTDVRRVFCVNLPPFERDKGWYGWCDNVYFNNGSSTIDEPLSKVLRDMTDTRRTIFVVGWKIGEMEDCLVVYQTIRECMGSTTWCAVVVRGPRMQCRESRPHRRQLMDQITRVIPPNVGCHVLKTRVGFLTKEDQDDFWFLPIARACLWLINSKDS